MKKIFVFVMLVVLALSTACGEPSLPEGELTLTAGTFRTGYPADYAMDGNTETGWICRKKASDANFQILTVDFGKAMTFQTVTLDDSFADGYTNTPPEDIQKQVVYNRGNVSSLEPGSSPANVISGSADGQSWISAEVPTEDAPQWLYISLREPVSTLRLVLNNQMNNSVPTAFRLYVSSSALGRDPEIYTDPNNYTLLKEETENENNVIEYVLDEETVISDLLLIITSQTNEGEPCVASLDEILFYESAEGYTETHQPVRFTMMYSMDGGSYEVFLEETANYSPVYQKTLDQAITCRFVRYLVFEEYNRNYPSIGELSFT